MREEEHFDCRVSQFGGLYGESILIIVIIIVVVVEDSDNKHKLHLLYTSE